MKYEIKWRRGVESSGPYCVLYGGYGCKVLSFM